MLNTDVSSEEIKYLVNNLTLPQKIDRALTIIDDYYSIYKDKLIVANSLGKDSCVVWHLAKIVSPNIKGFIVTTPYKPKETVDYMNRFVAKHPECKVYRSNEVRDKLYLTDPDECCNIFKVEPTKQALKETNAKCWVTGLRCTEGRTRTDYREVENRDKNLLKVNPILLWEEREIWQYLAMNQIETNELYKEGYRSLGCAPCTSIAAGGERDGRWINTSKCGGECGIHTKPLKEEA